MSTYVLVHGAWHGGWCWHKVASRLEAKGHRVVAPDFPGHGEDKTPIEDVTFPAIVERICKAIDAQKEPVVLVGHSYGGAVITQAGELRAGRVRKLVYVTAFIVGDGQTVMDVARQDRENDLGDAIAYAADGRTATLNAAALKPALYARCGDDDIALARASVRPEAMTGMQVPIRTSPANWGKLPRVYVECTEDRAISIAQQRRMHQAHPCEAVHTLETDHSPFFSTPDELTEILASL